MRKRPARVFPSVVDRNNDTNTRHLWPVVESRWRSRPTVAQMSDLIADRTSTKGLLKDFNAAYRAHGLAAQANGRSAKGGDVPPGELLASVFSGKAGRAKQNGTG